ncbi:hypothetical protein HW555_007622 [Spodoptera exigua]|uniref:Uncharacterized protein n=1 Tax=Spodoptera exigua TaxID=7107 RepID=A0A835GCM3_SPOEX|nr:hypothetical protein HW555_007622 [Spodoptera exigua]
MSNGEVSVVNGGSAWLSPAAILKKFGAKKGRIPRSGDLDGIPPPSPLQGDPEVNPLFLGEVPLEPTFSLRISSAQRCCHLCVDTRVTCNGRAAPRNSVDKTNQCSVRRMNKLGVIYLSSRLLKKYVKLVRSSIEVMSVTSLTEAQRKALSYHTWPHYKVLLGITPAWILERHVLEGFRKHERFTEKSLIKSIQKQSTTCSMHHKVVIIKITAINCIGSIGSIYTLVQEAQIFVKKDGSGTMRIDRERTAAAS